MEAVCIGEVGALAAQFSGFAVHVGHEVRNGAVHRFGKDVAGVAVRFQQHAVEQIFNGNGLACLKAANYIGRRDLFHRCLAHRDHVAGRELAVFNGLHHKQSGHDFGNAGGIGPLVGFHVVEYFAMVGVQEHSVGAE